jgi:hypothetical protein
VITLKVNLKKAVFVYIIIYILFFSLSSLYLKSNTISIIYDTKLIVDDRVGFDVSPDAITFGMIPQGNSASRAINIISSDYEQKVQILVRGNISKFLTISENIVFVKANEDKKINFDVYIPTDTKFGEYSGEIKIKITEFKT